MSATTAVPVMGERIHAASAGDPRGRWMTALAAATIASLFCPCG
ncbi:MAG TPA: hypothetical protein VGF63_09890 [Solirubrobacteraceae bacterium]